MKLRDILKDVEADGKDLNINIKSITHDSRKLKNTERDCLFVAVNGLDFDGHKFVGDAYKSGCRNFLTDSDKQNKLSSKYPDANFISVPDTQKVLPIIAKNFYNNPSSKLKLIGITGTNGKTTTAFAVFSCLQKLGKKVGMIGTIEYRICDKIIPAPNTTPDALSLNELIDQMAKSGVEYLVMEVSSHALSLHRVDGLNFDIAAFTNFTQDHLDYHKTMEKYLQAKIEIFNLLARSSKGEKVAVINADIKELRIMNYELRMTERRQDHSSVFFRTTSLKNPDTDYFANNIKTDIKGSRFVLNMPTGNVPIEIAMAGKPNVYNFTMAFAILSELGFSKNDIAAKLSDIKVKGRMETVANDRGIGVIIDYAHTPDGLENLLNTVHEIVEPNKKIITVFGAGGDRDKTKRPLMGKIASKLSDFIVITSDNPRTENPMSIIEDIKTGIDKDYKNYEIIEDRKNAIKQALLWATKGDIIVIAGKGHEEYQIIGKEKHCFSDKKIIKENL